MKKIIKLGCSAHADMYFKVNAAQSSVERGTRPALRVISGSFLNQPKLRACLRSAQIPNITSRPKPDSIFAPVGLINIGSVYVDAM